MPLAHRRREPPLRRPHRRGSVEERLRGGGAHCRRPLRRGAEAGRDREGPGGVQGEEKLKTGTT